ncbi:t-SNARE [Zychaea mexicana]|uniref:t-SNARE n=1 Tax=Zychaea mexicana TaxID=64656 RepID=UPI0022FE23DB|nr:t-SNARE [Zychaea mexicana]KAI9492824.1 t-SNARE [Zychaea mexicana]
MNNKRERYTISRDRMADLRAAAGSTDSTEAFGPRRNTSSNTNATRPSPRAEQRTASPPPSSRQYASARRSTTTQDEKVQVADLQSMDGFLEEVDSITAAIREVNHSIDGIGRLHDASLDNFSSRHAKQLDSGIDDISRQNQEIKQRIKTLAGYCDLGSEARIRQTQADRVRQEFVHLIQRFQDMERGYAKKYRQRVERQIRIVKPDATEGEIDQIIDSDQQNQVFAQSLMNSNRNGQANAVLSEVQTRNDDIKKIERVLLDLHQLFEDMQTIIEQQGQTLDRIEDHTTTAADDIEKGVKHVDQAIKIAKRTRAKKWCCFFIFLVLIIVAAFLIWWFGFNHKGVGDNP